MRLPLSRIGFPSLALLAILGPGSAGATVSRIDYGRSWTAGSEVAIFRRSTNEMVIHGSLLDLNTGLEVRRNGAAVSDPAVTLVSKTGGDDTRITVRVTGDTNTPLGSCELLIHYAVEANGPDRVKLRVWDRGSPTAATVVPAFPKAGESVKVTFTGTGLANAQFKITDFPDLNRSFQEHDRTDTKYSFTCIPIFPGDYAVNGLGLVDRNLPSDLRDLDTARYDVRAAGLFVKPNPIATSVSRPVSGVGETFTISGANLAGNDPRRFKTIVRYDLYSPTAFEVVPRFLIPSSATTGAVVFTMPDNLTPGTVRVVIQDELASSETSASTPVFFVAPTRAPQNITVTKTTSRNGTPPLITTAPLAPGLGQRIFCSTDTMVIRSEFTNVPLSDVGVSWAGVTMTPLLQQYFHSVNVTSCAPISRSTFLLGKLRVSNGISTGSIALASTKGATTSGPGSGISDLDYAFIPPPSNAAIVGDTVTVRRGGTLSVSGTNVFMGAFGAQLKPRLLYTDVNGSRQVIEALDVATSSALFMVPATAALGKMKSMSFEHYGGSTGVAGAVTIAP